MPAQNSSRQNSSPSPPERGTGISRKTWLMVVFLLSGIAGLGYQVVWAKLFSAGFGHEFPAVLAVVTAFMAGLALGAFTFDRLPRSFTANPRSYGWLELVIGGWGLVSIFLIPAINDAVVQLLDIDTTPLAHWTIVFLVVLFCLLPGTAAMGATLPAIELALTAGFPRKLTGLLYGANTVGAVLGAIVSAWYLMPRLGLRGTVLTFAVLNLFCGLTALLLTRSQPAVPPATTTNPALPAKGFGFLLLATGLLGIAYEVIAIRVLSHTLENTIFTFALVLAVYLAGTAMGAFVYQRISRHLQDISRLFAALAVACLFSGILARWLNPAYHAIRDVLGDTPTAVLLSELIATLLLLGLPTLVMGATFASLAQTSLARRHTLGWALSLNTLGAAFAPPLFGTVLFPWLGTRGTLWIIVLGYATLIPGRSWKVPATLAALILGFALPRSADLIETSPGTKIVTLENDVMGTVAVLQETNGHRVLKVNNRFQMGGTAAATAEQLQADISLLLHPNPKTAAFLGLGTGITFATALHYPGLEAHGVELVPAVADLMPLFASGSNIFTTPSLRSFVGDARRFIRTTSTKYDVIIGDLFHPAQDGTGFLYTVEHFQAVRDQLAPGGLFCQWLPLYQMDDQVLRGIIRTFREIFPDATAWLLRLNIETPVIGLVGGADFSRFGSQWIERRLDNSPLADHLRQVALADSVRLFGLFLAGPEELRIFSQNAPLNTDDHPRVIFRAPEFTYQRSTPPHTTLKKALDELSSDPAVLLLPGLDPDLARQLRLYVAARNTYLDGLIRKAEGEIAQAISLFIESARISPDFTSGYAQAITIATALAQSNPAAAEQILRALAEAQPARGLAQDLLRRLGFERNPD